MYFVLNHLFQMSGNIRTACLSFGERYVTKCNNDSREEEGQSHFRFVFFVSQIKVTLVRPLLAVHHPHLSKRHTIGIPTINANVQQ